MTVFLFDDGKFQPSDRLASLELDVVFFTLAMPLNIQAAFAHQLGLSRLKATSYSRKVLPTKYPSIVDV